MYQNKRFQILQLDSDDSVLGNSIKLKWQIGAKIDAFFQGAPSLEKPDNSCWVASVLVRPPMATARRYKNYKFLKHEQRQRISPKHIQDLKSKFRMKSYHSMLDWKQIIQSQIKRKYSHISLPSTWKNWVFQAFPLCREWNSFLLLRYWIWRRCTVYQPSKIHWYLYIVPAYYLLWNMPHNISVVFFMYTILYIKNTI